MADNNHKNRWKDSDVEDHWDKVAQIYIEENYRVNETHTQRFIESVKWLGIDNNSRILNISSRDCEAADYILNKNPGVQIVNAEISQGLIDVARKVRPYAEQVKIDTYSELPFKDKSFNRIVTLETLEHVEDPIKFLNELFRVSTDDAIMVLSCPPKTSEFSYRIYTFFAGGHGEGPHRFLKSGEVKQMFRKTGWKLAKHYGTLLIPVGPGWIRRLGDRIMNKYQNTFISELGIRQFYVCKKY